MKINFGKLLLVFIIVPFVELYILLEIASRTSALTALSIVVITGIVGAYYAKEQGQRVIQHIRLEINSGRMPGNGLLHGLCVLIGGILLLTPGVLTDLFGLSLLLPFTRVKYIKFMKNYISDHFSLGSIQSFNPHRDNFY